MISRQVPALYLDADDVGQVWDSVRTSGGVLMRERSPSVTPVEESEPDPSSPFYLIAQRTGVSRLHPTFVQERGHFVLAADSSPVIEWFVPWERASELRPGRVYFQENLWLDEHVVEQDLGFLTFAQAVRRLVVAFAPTYVAPWGSRVRLGPSARRRVLDREVTLATNP